MLVTTTHTLGDRKVGGYLGVCTGQAIYGANVFRDMFASFRDIFGGRSGAYEKVLSGGRETAIQEMCAKATAMGADAVIAVTIDYQAVGKKGSMLMVAATGTAVKTS